jgi:hypothetical protein
MKERVRIVKIRGTSLCVVIGATWIRRRMITIHVYLISYSRLQKKDILYFSYTHDTVGCTESQAPSQSIEKKYPRGGEFRSLPDDLLNCIQKVSLRCHLPPGTYGKHPCLQNHVRVKPAPANSLRTSVATDLNSAPVVLGHRRAIKSNRISRSTLMLRE